MLPYQFPCTRVWSNIKTRNMFRARQLLSSRKGSPIPRNADNYLHGESWATPLRVQRCCNLVAASSYFVQYVLLRISIFVEEHSVLPIQCTVRAGVCGRANLKGSSSTREVAFLAIFIPSTANPVQTKYKDYNSSSSTSSPPWSTSRGMTS
jgi:hypothetical protein